MIILTKPLFSLAHSLALMHGLALSQLHSTSDSYDRWGIQIHDPFTCIWNRLQHSGQICFIFSIPINISRHHEIWPALAQIWYPPLMHCSQHCQKRVMLKCSGQLYRLKMPVPARLKRISKLDCWYNKPEEDVSNNSTEWRKAVNGRGGKLGEKKRG